MAQVPPRNDLGTAEVPPQGDLRQLPLGELVKQLAEETSTLVRQELDLAKAEMTQKGKRAGLGIGQLGGAGVAALYALGALTACIIAALSLAMPVWVAALIVTVIYAAVAAVLYFTGRRQLATAAPPTPELTQQSIKEDVEWVKTQSKSSER
ncbi:MAG: phage holin family protein [Candidatus Dormibacteraeota bacterium]|nr:phage holin family protein [Candidatus Dormibacteraeota bacterium]